MCIPYIMDLDRQIYSIFESLKKEMTSMGSIQSLDQAYYSVIEIIQNQYKKEMDLFLTQMNPIEWNDNLLLKE